ncbi:MAG: GNAT family N-acetyltransferase [Mucilaginibacter sp.]
MNFNNYPVMRRLRTNEPAPFGLLLLADEEMQAINRYIHQSEIYVAETDGKLVGVYVLFPVDEYTAEIKAIAVDPDYQNQGIGKLMLNHAGIEAQAKGFKELIVGTPTIAEKQLNFYRRAGFVLFDVKKDFFIDYYTALIFEDGVQLTDMAMLKKLLYGKTEI